ncbi:CIC11C00000004508 [Sungouiella intermedia]|uniref:CIC11C00000004508 n=1 Tax=Sungouiella intermedia TaxID=45354 RepID=A0A1L0BF31_9ASCO|nr:CIC11C00000004508 [[Candida] intermedia]
MLRRLALLSARHYSGPPIKRYNGFTNWPSLKWHTAFPAPAKIFTGVLSAAVTITHVHHNTLVTLGPPVAVGTYFIMRRINHQRFLRLLEGVRPENTTEWDDDGSKIRIWKYDETNVQNVLHGIDNEFQHKLAQALEVVEKKVVDYVVELESSDSVSLLVSLLLDENKQVVMHLGESPETFVTTRAEVVDRDGAERFVEFLRFSVALYSSKNIRNRRRLAVADVSLLAVPETEEAEDLDYRDYRMTIELTPYKLFGKPEKVQNTKTEISSADNFKQSGRN